MGNFYIYFRDLTVRAASDFERLRLEHLIDLHPSGIDDRLAFFPDWSGPEGTVGTLVVTTPADEMPAMEAPKCNMDRQTWFSLESGSAWLSFETKDPPGPEVLQRRAQFVGSSITLGDSNNWLLAQFNELPLRMALSPDSVPMFFPTATDILAKRLTFELLTFYADVGEINAMVNSGKLCPPGCRTLVEYALGKNYRGSWELFEKLGLFEVDPIVVAAAATIAIGLQEAAQTELKKHLNQSSTPSLN